MVKNGVIFDKKNILVIGGAGFVGSHLCDELVKSNKVICVDNFMTGHRTNIEHLLQNADFELVKHDMNGKLDLERLPELEKFRVEFQGVQEIYFLASPTSPVHYTQMPIETMLANSVALRLALDMAVKYKAKFLYVSSPAVYGQVEPGQVVNENMFGAVDQLGPRAAYEEAKRFGEALVNIYRTQHNIDAKIARVFNCYGPRMVLSDGRMIPELIKNALAEKEVVVYGQPSDKVSYFYVSDLVKGLLKLMDSGQIGPVNLGSDNQIDLKSLVEQIVSLCQSSSQVNYQDRLDIMSPQPIPDISLAKQELGWFPIVLLKEGLQKTIDYLNAQEEIIGPDRYK